MKVTWALCSSLIQTSWPCERVGQPPRKGSCMDMAPGETSWLLSRQQIGRNALWTTFSQGRQSFNNKVAFYFHLPTFPMCTSSSGTLFHAQTSELLSVAWVTDT